MMQKTNSLLSIVFSSEKMKNSFKNRASGDECVFSLNSVIPIPRDLVGTRRYAWTSTKWGTTNDVVSARIESETRDSISYLLESHDAPTASLFVMKRNYNFIKKIKMIFYSPSVGMAGELMVLDYGVVRQRDFDVQYDKEEYVKFAEMFDDFMTVEELVGI